VIEAVVFDLDGVLIDSEECWDDARRAIAGERGLPWPPTATLDMMGMSSIEWSAYMHERIGLPESPAEISDEVVRRLEEIYRERLPLFPGALEAVRRLAARFRLGLASSSNRELIDLVLELAGIGVCFEQTVSSEEVGRGKPAPDVYLEVLRRMSVSPAGAAAVEDSHNGLLAAHAAGMRVIAVPNPAFAPGAEALAAAHLVIRSLDELGVEAVVGDR
jgi:HAD superfamily hydrolase (TIGR01509 family)